MKRDPAPTGWSVVAFLTLIYLASAALVETGRPRLELHAYPLMSIAAPGGCSSVLFAAEIKGPEAEDWYCPSVRWGWPDGTHSFEESDCPSWQEKDEFPRRWSRRVCLPSNPDPMLVVVKLERRGDVIATQTVEVTVK